MGHRIAVLRDGVLQQLDTPQTLYDRPANLFVAGFIGSPAMNFFPAEIAGDHRPIRRLLGCSAARLTRGRPDAVGDPGRPSHRFRRLPTPESTLPRIAITADLVESLGGAREQRDLPRGRALESILRRRPLGVRGGRGPSSSPTTIGRCSPPGSRPARPSPRQNSANSRCTARASTTSISRAGSRSRRPRRRLRRRWPGGRRDRNGRRRQRWTRPPRPGRPASSRVPRP